MGQVVQVKNEKAKSMIYAEESVQFISKSVTTVEEFNDIFNKKITLADKGELKYQDMKKITLDGLTVDPHVGMKLGNSVSDISFENETDRDEFIQFVSEKKGWSKKETQQTPLNAIKWYLAGFIFTPIFAYVIYGVALEIESGTHVADEGYGKAARKSRFFDSIIEMIGSNGVLIISILTLLYLGYFINKNYKNPPIITSYE